MTKREIDAHTGVETTGHEWDGIKELNKPLPRWWLWTFYASIVWAIGYWILFPSWPTVSGYTKGLWNFSQRTAVAADLRQAAIAQAGSRQKIESMALSDIRRDADLLRFATVAGNASFQTNCAPCHGRNAQGFVGYPSLNDDDWIWGGSVEEIHETILYGIRSSHARTRNGEMPRFGQDRLLADAEIDAVAEYVLWLSKKSTDPNAIERGSEVWKAQCADCHGADGRGKKQQGSLNLADEIWLYGGTKAAIVESIRTGRGGAMPAWIGRLDAVTLKSLALYVHSLGGGK
jgi:cytochrome c oxidase cbb3-type subunit III